MTPRSLIDSPESSRLPGRAALLVGVALLAALVSVGSSARGAAASGAPLDPSFGDRGVVLAADPPGAVGLSLVGDDRGRLIAAGTNVSEEFLLRRFEPDGSQDLSFGEGGKVETQLGAPSVVQALAVQGDGKILAAGGTETAFGLVRYLPSGEVDRGFGRRGQLLTPVGSEGAAVFGIALQPSGRMLVAGYGRDLAQNWTAVVVAYRPNGAIDRSFGRRGMFRIFAGNGAAVAFSGIQVLPSGKVLLAGDRNGKLMLVRLLPSGTPDKSFGGGDGRVSVDADRVARCACAFATSLAAGPEGRPLIAGILTGPGPESSFLARFTPSGKLDRTFGRDGLVRTLRGSRLVSNDAAVQPDGHIVTVGSYVSPGSGQAQLAILRYLPTGELDPGFGRSGFFTQHVGRESIAHALISQPGGRVVVAGRANLGRPSSSEAGSALDGAQILLMRLRASSSRSVTRIEP
jgi:uncharacterized delta-60 repeat protein